MEYVKGKSLKDLLAEGPMKTGRALDIAAQIAEGLHAAHEKGVVHRDMKNANVMVTDRDHVKIMDFGLAKLKGASLLTKQGTTLGTVSYMSPEQARGESVDHRTDIWSFGVVLYEMLTGRSPFAGEFEQAIIYNILNNEPEPLTAVRSNMPMELERIVNKCLAKEPSERYQNIQEVPVDLRAVKSAMKSSSSDLSRSVTAARMGYTGTGSTGTSTTGRVASSGSPAVAGTGTGRARLVGRAGWIIAAVMAIIAGGSLYLNLTRTAPEPGPVRLQVTLPRGEALNVNIQKSMDISRDGSTIVYRTVNGLFLRRLDKIDPVPINGTERGTNPFFSPDGKWVGFAADGKMQKVQLDGGAPFPLAEIGDFRGASWGSNGKIIFTPSTGTGVQSVSEMGGAVTPVTIVDTTTDERTHRWPELLPDNTWVLFTVGVVQSPDFYEDANIDAVNIETGERKTVVRGASSARYLRSGHLLYSRSGVLYAVPFDADRVEVTGPPVPMVQNLAGDPTSGAMNYAVSDGGTLAYIPGQVEINIRKLVKYELGGKSDIFNMPPQTYAEPKVSPDGSKIAVTIGLGRDFDIWVYDIARNNLSRLTFGGVNRTPVWSPDGKRIAYFSYKTRGDESVAMMRSDGSGKEEILFRVKHRFYIDDWTRDGRYLILDLSTQRNSSDIGYIPVDNPKEVINFLDTRNDEFVSAVSPNGKWIAYQSNETGVYQIFVRNFPEGSGKWQISNAEGYEARWAPDSRRLYFLSGGGLMAVDIDTAGTFSAGPPKTVLSGINPLPVESGHTYDLSLDGRSIVTTISSTGDESLDDIQVVLNFFSDLKQKTGNTN